MCRFLTVWPGYRGGGGVPVWPRHAGSTRSPKPRLAVRCAATPRPVRRRPFVAPRQIRPCRISHLESVFGVAAGVRTPAEDRHKTNEFPELAPAIAHLDLICAVMTWMTSTRGPGNDYATGTTIGYESCYTQSIGDNAFKPWVRRRSPSFGGVEPLKQTLRRIQLQSARTPAAVVGSVLIWRCR